MENYNRLFLLEDEEQDFDALKNQILNEEDVTDPKEYAGSVTLGQINAYSGEFKSEALTNFKTIKVDKASGEASETNLAKLLLELQGEGGVEDAIEEALIKVESLDDSRSNKHELREFMGIMSDVQERIRPNAVEVIPEFETFIQPVLETGEIDFTMSDISADGVNKQFVVAERYSEKSFICTKNGVVQDNQDGFILSAADGRMIGFEFVVAPLEGDVIYMSFDSNYSDNEETLENAKANLKLVNGDNEDDLIDYIDARDASIAIITGETAETLQALKKSDEDIKAFEVELETIRETFEDSEDVSEVNTAYESYSTKHGEILDKQVERLNHRGAYAELESRKSNEEARKTEAIEALDVIGKIHGDIAAWMGQQAKAMAEVRAAVDTILGVDNPPADS